MALASASAATPGTGAATAGSLSLKQLTLEELMNVQVTSVLGMEQAYRESAAALSVVTGEHLRRSGATTIPEALRWVPGIHVGGRNASSWAISSRGFSSINSEKLLVLSDTRSIYTPLFSGVFWDVQDYLLADIDRIEVVRGPGATLWGANAVNGVVNITTKHAAETHGTHLELLAGTEERFTVAARHGAQTAGGVHFRVFGKYSDRDATFHSSAGNSDDWRLAHLGFRADWSPRTSDEFTVQGDVYRGEVGQLAPAVEIIGRPGPPPPLEADVSGGNVLARWRHWTAADSDVQLRAYYDYTHRDDPSFTDELDTFDVDLRHRLAAGARHKLVWGLNYRFTSNRNEGKGVFAVAPESSEDHLFSGFVQDQIALRDNLRVTLGTKAEHNDFSGFELQPSLRAAWEIAPHHTLWAAVSRAVRSPTRLERDLAIDVTDPAADPHVRFLGNRDFEAEELIAYEAGYRWQAAEMLHLDVAVFENRYDGLASLELGDPDTAPDGRTIVPLRYQNLTDGRARGIETLLTVYPLSRWRVTASHSYLHLSLDPRGEDLNRGEFYEGATPRHQFALSSYLALPAGFEFDAHFRRVGPVRRFTEDVTGAGIPGYHELDLVLTWHATLNTRLSLVGKNLLHDRHLEWGGPAARGEIERSVYAKITWDF